MAIINSSFCPLFPFRFSQSPSRVIYGPFSRIDLMIVIARFIFRSPLGSVGDSDDRSGIQLGFRTVASLARTKTTAKTPATATTTSDGTKKRFAFPVYLHVPSDADFVLR